MAEPYRAPVLWISWDLFETLGVDPAAGRHFLPEEGADGGPDVAIVSHGFWQDRLGGGDEVIGSTIALDGSVTTVVGVRACARFRA